jgi:hypothetical protein
MVRPPLWSSGQFLATDLEVRVRFPALPDFLRSSGSGMGSTQGCKYNKYSCEQRCFVFLIDSKRNRMHQTRIKTIEELLERNSSCSGLENRENGKRIRCAEHAIPSICKSWH